MAQRHQHVLRYLAACLALCAASWTTAADSGGRLWQLDLSGQTMRHLAATAGEVDSPARLLAAFLGKSNAKTGRCRVSGILGADSQPSTLTVIDTDRTEIDLHAYLARECTPTKANPEIYYNQDLDVHAAVRGSRLITVQDPALFLHPAVKEKLPAMQLAASGSISLNNFPDTARPRSAALQNVNSISFFASNLEDSSWAVTIDFHTISEEQATQTASIINGLIAFARLKQDKQDVPMVKIAESAKISTNGAIVRATATVTRVQLRETINPKPRAQVIRHE